MSGTRSVLNYELTLSLMAFIRAALALFLATTDSVRPSPHGLTFTDYFFIDYRLDELANYNRRSTCLTEPISVGWRRLCSLANSATAPVRAIFRLIREEGRKPRGSPHLSLIKAK